MNKNIMMLMFLAFTFHLGNAPQLPLVMQKIGSGFNGREGIPLGASAILIAQFGMAIMTYTSSSVFFFPFFFVFCFFQNFCFGKQTSSNQMFALRNNK